MRLHPFRALEPAPDRVARVVCPPYDVVSTDEARRYAAGNPDSFFHVTRAEIDLPPDADPHSDVAYAQARLAFERMVADGVLVEDEGEALWLYRLTMGEHVQTGLVGCAEVADYQEGRIKRHEHTRRDKEDDRTRHTDAISANAGPVFLACRATEALATLERRLTAGAPAMDVVTPNGVRHQLWPVRQGADQAAVAEALDALDAFYIADGHHRAASAARTRDLRRQRHPDAPTDAPFERFLAVVFPHDQLRILPYNRVLADLGGLTPDGFLEALSKVFEVGPPGAAAEPPARHGFGLYLQGTWRQLVTRPEHVDEHDPIARLDVAILQDHVLGPLLGITDPRTDPRVDFVGGIRGTGELERRVDAAGQGAAFAMYPTSLDELFAVADAGQVMPPKSTWFEPKLASGFLIHRI